MDDLSPARSCGLARKKFEQVMLRRKTCERHWCWSASVGENFPRPFHNANTKPFLSNQQQDFPPKSAGNASVLPENRRHEFQQRRARDVEHV
ncbi:MAG: hypothetical protein U0984_00545, partial [Prosthecobacter sp.]|nr:hypothetical protein [Prosthecobacter sp.]